jgi:pimeloyl-ACP methyl ester carboxylesterase
MSAFYFGSADRPLFGYHHIPQGVGTGAVVLCYPCSREYEFAHRSMQILGRRLAERGSHVLRFDYSGTGDSWGETVDVDLDAWTQDALQAMDELRAVSGRGKVDLLGLRIGAYVAARTAASGAGVRRLLLWDPIVDGAAWLAEVERDRLPSRADDTAMIGSTLVSRRLFQQVRAIRPESYQSGGAEETLVLLTQESQATGGSEPLPHLEGIERMTMDQPSAWIEDHSIWSGLVPVLTLNRVVEWLS